MGKRTSSLRFSRNKNTRTQNQTDKVNWVVNAMSKRCDKQPENEKTDTTNDGIRTPFSTPPILYTFRRRAWPENGGEHAHTYTNGLSENSEYFCNNIKCIRLTELRDGLPLASFISGCLELKRYVLLLLSFFSYTNTCKPIGHSDRRLVVLFNTISFGLDGHSVSHSMRYIPIHTEIRMCFNVYFVFVSFFFVLLHNSRM